MCGIAGVISYDSPPAAADALQMARTLTHRGPDDEGAFARGPAALAFRRLSIIDLQGGHQPMTRGPATLVFNGELYGFRELRTTLRARGHAFQTDSDTEVLLTAYLEWGEPFVSRLDGMFAFALWDERHQRLLAARDRFGKKPFYWTRSQGRFLFASELKGLLAHRDCPRQLDPAAVRRYLAFDSVPAPGTIFAGVHKLEEASWLTLDRGGVRSGRYWRPPPAARPGHTSRARPRAGAGAAEEGLRTRLEAAVQKRLVADVPLGVFLSGGIDSSAVAAFAARARPGIQTFCIGFEEDSYDESAYARRTARALGTTHREERLSAAACQALLPEAVEQLDEPFADASYLPTLMLCRLARRHVTVVLGGDGADELLAGYETFRAEVLGRPLAWLPRAVPRLGGRLLERLPASSGYMGVDYKARVFLRGFTWPRRYRQQAWIGSFTPEAIQDVLAPAYRSPGPDPAADVYAPVDAFEAACGERGLERTLRYYVATYLRDDILTKVDRASMACSLEVRSPFLDAALAEWVLALPTRFKMRGLRGKWLLRQALRGFVPDEVLHRGKHGFAIPVADWLRGPLRPLLEDLLSARALRDEGIFDPRGVRALVDAHMMKRVDHRKPLWSLLMFALWRRRWAMGAGMASPGAPAAVARQGGPS